MAMTDPASARQHGFLTTLLRERQVPAEVKVAMEMAASREDFTKAMASAFIDELMKLPKIEAPKAVAVTSGEPSVWDRLKALPKSRYVVNVRGTDTFVEIREFKGRTYMRKLLGAPGSYTRVKLSYGQVAEIVDLIAPNPLAAAQRYGELYSICGCCGAELTDEESRRLSLGPVCRERFGL